MAVVLVGDLDFNKTIKMVDQYFGKFQYKELPQIKKLSEVPMTSVVTRDVVSPTAERLTMAWRTAGVGTQEAMLAEVTAEILSNRGDVGLIDLNINQKQLSLGAYATTSVFNDYGYLSMALSVKDGQSLEQGRQLLLD